MPKSKYLAGFLAIVADKKCYYLAMKIYCSGIGGIGLSAYASHMQAKGHQVWGSDKSDSPLVQDLKKQGITITLNQDGSEMPEVLDLLVYSEAIPADAPERAKATKHGIRQISYFAALGEMTAGMNLIAVCGTHGKSSTTAMVSRLLIESGLDPNIVVGTKLRELNGRNWRQANNDLWAVEACEYRRSFHYLSPKIVLLTNADGDHYDAFKDLQDYEQAFVDFLRRLPEDGVIFAHGNDKQVQNIVKRAGKTMTDADRYPLITLKTPGLHMRQNAQLVLALADHLKLDSAKSAKIVSGYAGSWRRMEIKGTTKNDVIVIDDYGHHPIEIKATLSAMREAYPARRIVAVFQPHTHDRTIKLGPEFAKAFSDADLVVLTDVYDARPDRDSKKADVQALLKEIKNHSKVECVYAGTLAQAQTMLETSIIKPNDVLITLGAGDITKLADRMVHS